jgi:predicted dienelactone hydrolase
VPDLNGQPRTLDLFVWYPTDTQGPITPLLGATPGAPVATGAAELPVLLFSHGSCGIPNQSTLLTAELARAGWVTLAMSHPPNVLGPGCADPVSLFIAFTERPYDVSRALDWLLAENTDPGSALFGLVDATRVGLSGHSFGGMTSLIAPGLDARIRATMPLAPEYSSVEDLVDAGLPLPIPSLVQGGSLDATTPFLEDQAPLFPLMLAPRFLVEILQGDHGTFSDFCSGTACQPDLVRQYGFGFLGRYVAADRRWASLLEESPGTILTADP